MKFSFFKPPKHKKFDPVPRFYDPEKEYLEDKLKKINAGSTDEKSQKYEKIRSNIRSTFRDNRAGFGINRKQRRRYYNSNIRLIVILVFIIIITYILLVKYFPYIEELLR